MTRTKFLSILIAFTLILGFYGANAQTATSASTTNLKDGKVMKTYLIERNIPGAGKLTPEQLKGIAQKSCAVLKEMGPDIQWLQSYVTGDKIYCVYKAENEDLVREHAKKGGFPANQITEISSTISPATATNP